ncbi:MAG: GTP 3',8-cyclase MoaA [Myxococcota bacterium]
MPIATEEPDDAAVRPSTDRVPLDRLSMGDEEGALRRPPAPRPLVDGERRKVHYLRMSVTDRCNFRCRYCMPEEGVRFVPRRDLLSFEEVERLVACFVRLGIRRVRLTGGEPLLRRDVVDLVGRIGAVDGVEDLAMTTNGYALSDLAGPLRDAGLERLNISIDTLREDRFRTMTRTDLLSRVLEGIDAARDAGFSPIKLNVVVVRGFNDDELVDLVRFAAERGAVVRFIEYMPIGVDGFWSDDTFMSTGAMLERLAEDFDVREPIGHGPSAGIRGEGPAVYRELTPRGGGASTCVGFISALSHNFCSTCNRVRMTATGTLQECLAFPGALSLRDALRGGASDDEIVALVEEALWSKGPGHRFDVEGGGQRVYQSMNVTGG